MSFSVYHPSGSLQVWSTDGSTMIANCTPVFKKATLSRYALGQVGLAQITLDNPNNNLTGLFNYSNILKCYINAKEVFEGRLDTCKQAISPTEGQYMTLTAKDYGQDLLRKIEFYMQASMSGSTWVNTIFSDITGSSSDLTPVISGSNLLGNLALNISNAFGFDAVENVCETANADYYATVDKKYVITDPGLNDSGVKFVLNLAEPNNPAYNIKKIDFDEFDGLELGNQIYGLAGNYDESWLNTGSGQIGQTASQDSSGSLSWVNLQNLTNSGSYATFYGVGISYTNTLYVTNFGLNVPVGATILGVQVVIKRHTVANSGSSNNAYDGTVQLALAGMLTGSNIIPIASFQQWYQYVSGSSAVDEYKSFGGPTYLWGFTSATLTPEMVNSASFGVGLVAGIGVGGVSGSVGYIQINVFTETVTPLGEEFDCTEGQISSGIANGDWIGLATTGAVTLSQTSTGFSPSLSQYFLQATENSSGSGQLRQIQVQVAFPVTGSSWGGALGQTGSTMTGSYNFCKMHHKNITYCLGGLYLSTGSTKCAQPSGSIYVKDTWGNEIYQSGSFDITGSSLGSSITNNGFLFTGSRQTWKCGLNDSGSQAVWDDTLAWNWYPSGSTQYFDWSSVKIIRFIGYFSGSGFATLTLDGMMFSPMAYLNQDATSIANYGRKELLIERTDIVSYNILKDAVDTYLNCRKDTLQQTVIEAIPTWTEQGLDIQPSDAFTLNNVYYRAREITYDYSSDGGWTAKITAVPRYTIVDSSRILSGTIAGQLGALRKGVKELKSSTSALLK